MYIPITDPTLTVYHEPEMTMFWTEIDPLTNDVRLHRVTLPVERDPARLIVADVPQTAAQAASASVDATEQGDA